MTDFEKNYEQAKKSLFEGDWKKAKKLFTKINAQYERGYCELMLGNFEKTKKIWLELEPQSPVIEWGQSLLGFIELHVVKSPTFFQIRNFLEMDLDALLKARQSGFAENIINGAHIFAQINPESYKYLGRVLLNNKYYKISKMFLDTAKNICYKDPEVHFLLAKYYIANAQTEDAKKSLKTTLEIEPAYFPAKNLLL